MAGAQAAGALEAEGQVLAANVLVERQVHGLGAGCQAASGHANTNDAVHGLSTTSPGSAASPSSASSVSQAAAGVMRP